MGYTPYYGSSVPSQDFAAHTSSGVPDWMEQLDPLDQERSVDFIELVPDRPPHPQDQ